MATLTNFTSKITLTGTVTRVFSIPDADVTTVFVLASSAKSEHVPPAQSQGIASSNQLLLCCAGDWRISMAFVASPDLVEISHFDVGLPPPSLDLTLFPRGILCIYPNKSTELTVVRAKRVLINFSNVGSLTELDLTGREQKIAHYLAEEGALLPKLLPPDHHSPPAPVERASSTDVANRDRNLFNNVEVYYDVIHGQRSIIDRKVRFIERVLAARTRVLDLGCGTGLFAFALRADGIKVTCVDASPAMERAVRDKNQFVAAVEGPSSLLKGEPIPFHRADAASFSLSTLDSAGREKYVDFPAILAIDLLALLPSAEHVQRALHNMALHTSAGGVAIVSIPNLEVALATGNTQVAYRRAIDKFSLSVGAAACIPSGVLDVVEQVALRQLHAKDSLHPNNRSPELSDGVPRRSVAIVGNAFHENALTEEGMFVSFTERFTEILLSCGKFELLCKSAGFAVDALYGSMDGAPFVQQTSAHCVYVLRKV